MKLFAVLALIATAIWLPYAFLQAAELQAHIDARNAAVERLARATP